MPEEDKRTLPECLWGRFQPEELYKKYMDIFRFNKGRTVSKKEAREALDSFTSPEMREVIYELESQMEDSPPYAEYKNNRKETLLFSDWALVTDFYENFIGLLETAHPDYKWAEGSLNEIVLKRKQGEKK